MKLLFTNIRQLLTLDTPVHGLRRGKEMQNIGLVESAWLLIENGFVSGYGSMNEVVPQADEVFDCTNRIVLPGLIDSHTHLIFAQPREQEFVQKILGKSYEEIAASGGGILNSAQKIAETKFEELTSSAKQR
ncbi:MAG: imidazolonepropionase, partial [Bacteroidia bacterium]|nr:imidazolonepropionase [Bacteroidia bacterium]